MDIIRIIYHTLSRGARALMLDGGVDIIRIIHHTVDTLGYIFAQDKSHLGYAWVYICTGQNTPWIPRHVQVGGPQEQTAYTLV